MAHNISDIFFLLGWPVMGRKVVSFQIKKNPHPPQNGRSGSLCTVLWRASLSIETRKSQTAARRPETAVLYTCATKGIG